LNDLAASPATHALIVGESMGRRRVRDLVRRAGCSIWFVPNHPTPIVRRILVPIDFSVRSADCVRVATVLARLSGATEQCLAVHVYFNESLGTDPVQDQAIRTTLESTYARFMKSIDALNVVVRPLFREAAHVARAINRAADDEDADLIVLSTRGRNWASKFVRESVAEQTLTDCRVPILVLKHFGAQLGLLRALNEPASGWPSGLQFN
jgi:nucleotide-binding universal stress UspA family protein